MCYQWTNKNRKCKKKCKEYHNITQKHEILGYKSNKVYVETMLKTVRHW